MSDSSYDSSWGTDFESESFPRGLVRTRLSQIFRDIWDDSEHPRHRQYHEAIHPKLWACRCFPPPPIEVDEEDDEYKDGGDHCPQFLERYEIYAYIGGGCECDFVSITPPVTSFVTRIPTDEPGVPEQTVWREA